MRSPENARILLSEAGNVGVVELGPGLAQGNQGFQLVELRAGFVAGVGFDFLAVQFNDDLPFDGPGLVGGKTAMIFEEVGQLEFGNFKDVRFERTSN
jgi:hypothetical protein